MTPKKVKNLTGDTKSHSKFEPNMICSFGAILAWKSDEDDDADDDYNDDRKSDPYMSPSYAGDTKIRGHLLLNPDHQSSFKGMNISPRLPRISPKVPLRAPEPQIWLPTSMWLTKVLYLQMMLHLKQKVFPTHF